MRFHQNDAMQQNQRGVVLLSLLMFKAEIISSQDLNVAATEEQMFKDETLS